MTLQATTGAKKDEKSSSKRAQQILDTADEVLNQVDQGYIFSVAKKECRAFPKFDSSEIENGTLLGTGGFSGVKEVLSIQVGGVNHYQEGEDDDADEVHGRIGVLPKVDEEHYDVATASEFMSKRCIRYGSPRYAIKRLKSDLNEVERARGAVDLAIETKYLSVIWHPNIIKMRAVSNTPRLSTETFLIMDRLYGTLENRIEQWEESLAVAKGCCGITDKKNPVVKELLQARLLVAYDLSTAFNYLHGLKLIYRDIKPENIGFDIRGDVKLFDFGLCKSLDRKHKDHKGYGYKLTAKTGSIPYMAPEVALGKSYDKEADVFSFAILLWEILSLDWAFNGYKTPEYVIKVCKQNERLPIRGSWPVIMRTIVAEAWDKDPQKRPSMKRIGTLIRAHVEGMTEDSSVINRTEHMLNRSKRSQRNLTEGIKQRRSSLSSRCNRDSFVGGSEILGNSALPKEHSLRE